MSPSTADCSSGFLSIVLDCVGLAEVAPLCFYLFTVVLTGAHLGSSGIYFMLFIRENTVGIQHGKSVCIPSIWGFPQVGGGMKAFTAHFLGVNNNDLIQILF